MKVKGFTLLSTIVLTTSVASAQMHDEAPIRASLGMPQAPGPDTLPAPRPSIVSGPVANPPLRLDDVLASVDQTYPLLIAAEQERAIAQGRTLSAQGVFDLTLRYAESVNQGSYDNHRVGLGLEQPLPFSGLSTFAGYRLGAGTYPVYYGDRKTAEGGEFRAGIVVPLLRDRTIDRRRAGLQTAQINELLADPLVQRARIDYFRAASVAYWNWVAAGQRVRLARQLLKTARDRNEGLAVLAKKGAIKGIEVTDNERAILERQGRLVVAERRLQQAAIALALYLRTPDGAAVTPTEDRLPESFPMPDPVDLAKTDGEIALALRTRPELERFRLLKARTDVEIRLAENQMLPGVNLALSGAQDVGLGKKDLDRAAYEAMLLLDVPLQRREARGRILTGRATLTQINLQERYQFDTIVAEVKDAMSAMERAYELIGRVQESVRLARLVEEGERERMRLGSSTILFVNLRELVTFDAESLVLDAYLDYARARADYRAALGVDGKGTLPGPP